MCLVILRHSCELGGCNRFRRMLQVREANHNAMHKARFSTSEDLRTSIAFAHGNVHGIQQDIHAREDRGTADKGYDVRCLCTHRQHLSAI